MPIELDKVPWEFLKTHIMPEENSTEGTDPKNASEASSHEMADDQLQDVTGGYELGLGWEKLPPAKSKQTWDLIRTTADPR